MKAGRRAILLAALALSLLAGGPGAGAARGVAVSDRNLYPLCKGLLELQAGGRERVKVMHFGDSHIASDDESSVVRGALQQAFGDGGPGFCMPWSPPRFYRRFDVTTGSSRGWRRVLPSRDGAQDYSAPNGCYIEADGAGEKAWAQAAFSSLKVYLLKQAGGGKVEISVDGQILGTEDLASAQPDVAVFSRALKGGDKTRRLEIRSVGPGKVRVLGASMEKSCPGVVYSQLGIIGGRVDLLTKSRDDSFSRIMGAEAPDLVLIGFGTNEAGDKPFDGEAYSWLVYQVVERVKKASPKAAVAILTPPDRANGQGSAAIARVVAAQVKACERSGALLLDLYGAMGGEGSFSRWLSSGEQLASADGVHFTGAGYERLGRLISAEIAGAYNRVKSSEGFKKGLKGDETLLALAASPVKLGEGSRVTTLASSTAVEPEEEKEHEIYYFRNAKGVLVITDDPDYGRSAGESGGAMSRSDEGELPLYYFEEEGGRLVIVSDRSEVEGRKGRFLTQAELKKRRAAAENGSQGR